MFKVKNYGTQDLNGQTTFTARIGGKEIGEASRPKIRTGETVEIPFVIPQDLKNGESLLFTLSAVKQHAHEWKFENISVQLPSPSWFWYLSIAIGLTVVVVVTYYLRFYRHPLMLQVMENPESIKCLTQGELEYVVYLLRHTRRLKTVLAQAGVNPLNLEKTLQLYKLYGSITRIGYPFILQRLEAVGDAILEEDVGIYNLRLKPDFILNMESCLLVLAPRATMSAAEVFDRLKQVDNYQGRVCVIIDIDDRHFSELQREAAELDNLFVVPAVPELTELLLSPEPLQVFARIIASQVKVTRISPFQTGGGVDKESVFFGREQLLAHVMQREPTNYLLVGGRQLGKSSLLKALERRYHDRSEVICRYLVLSGENPLPHFARALDLPMDTPLEQLTDHMARVPGGKRYVFLVDEADRFIATQAGEDYRVLHHFRHLSEEGKCYFIFAGFWHLYSAAVLDYQSPLKNFAHTLTVDALEEDACRKLATVPMGVMNIHYESPELVDLLIRETGQRANLIALACDELLKNLDMTARTIQRKQLEDVLDGPVINRALGGWSKLTGQKENDRLDRVIVYAMINRDDFSIVDVMDTLATQKITPEPESVRESLQRLELAFILAREKDRYSFRVPLFKKMILQLDPERMLELELRG